MPGERGLPVAVVDVRGNPTAVLLTSSPRDVKARAFRELIQDYGAEQACTLSLLGDTVQTRMMGGELSLNGTVAAGGYGRTLATVGTGAGPGVRRCGDPRVRDGGRRPE